MVAAARENLMVALATLLALGLGCSGASSEASDCKATADNPFPNCQPFTCEYRWPFCEPKDTSLETVEEDIGQFSSSYSECKFPPDELPCNRATPAQLATIEEELADVPSNKQAPVRCLSSLGVQQPYFRADWFDDDGEAELYIDYDATIELSVSGEAVLSAVLDHLGPAIGAALDLPSELKFEVLGDWDDNEWRDSGDIRAHAISYKGIPVITEVVDIDISRIMETECATRFEIHEISAIVAKGLRELDMDPADEISANEALQIAIDECGLDCSQTEETKSLWPLMRGVVGSEKGARVAWAVVLACEEGEGCPCTYLVDAVEGSFIEPGLRVCQH